ncbi:hypothetical protein HanIR_Chr11g0523561 [Helianthus annuus]|nr:hypothetical protein HanIR_Chr11g0523561 [Helianthus annuus]
MASAFTNTIVPRATSYPPMVQSSDDSCGTNSGAAGNSLSVSLTMHWMYGRFGRSVSCTKRSCRVYSSISALAFSKTLG